MDNYNREAKERWGKSEAYREYEQKTSGYSKESFREIAEGLTAVFERFAECKRSGKGPDSNEAGLLCEELKGYISDNYYTCTNEILAGLGQMYVSDERFKTNIDSHGEGTAEFVAEAIKAYCN